MNFGRRLPVQTFEHFVAVLTRGWRFGGKFAHQLARFRVPVVPAIFPCSRSMPTFSYPRYSNGPAATVYGEAKSLYTEV